MQLTIKEIQHYETEILKEVATICKKHNLTYYLAYGSVLGAVRHQGPIPWDSDIDIAVPVHQMTKFIAIMRKELSEEYYLDYFDTNVYYPFLFPRIGLKGYSTNILHIDVFKLVGIPSNSTEQIKFKKKVLPYNTLFKYKNIHQKYGAQFSLKGKIFYSLIKLFLSPISNKYIVNRFNQLANKYTYKTSDFIMNINGEYGDREFIPKNFYGTGTVSKYANIEVTIPEKHHEYLSHFYIDYMKLPPKEEQKVSSSYKITEIK